MRSSSTFIAAAIVVLLGTFELAWAQRPPKPAVIGEPAPELYYSERGSRGEDDEGEPILEPHRRHIVLMYFFRTDDPESMETFPKVLEVARKYRDKGVVVLGFTTEEQSKVEDVLAEHGAEWHMFYAGGEALGIDILDYVYRLPAFPRVYMVDTQGILVDHFHPLDRLEERVINQLERTPPPAADPSNFPRWIMQARQAQAAGEHGKAYTWAKDVFDLTREGEGVHGEAAALMEQVQQDAEQWLEKARQAARAEEYDKACRIFAEVSVRFPQTDVGAAADREISRLMGNIELKPKLRAAKEEARARKMLDECQELIATKRFFEGLKLLRALIERYPDTDTATDAGKVIDQITENPQAMATIKQRRAEEQAHRWLDIGDRYNRVKVFDKAREYYQRVIKEFPQSKSAQKARERLGELPKDETQETASQGDSEQA